ncbi:hypothetical protein, partial [Mycobacterium simiae]|uniref:hypothetical protein n=1 Tax=Mycobacterium simiae TaxID=1784 RepID=UPI001E3EDCE6
MGSADATRHGDVLTRIVARLGWIAAPAPSVLRTWGCPHSASVLTRIVARLGWIAALAPSVLRTWGG